VELVLTVCGAAGFVPRVAQEASQLHTLSGLVSAGLGITLLPSSIASAPRAGVTFRPLAGDAPRLALDVIWRPGDLSHTAEQFVSVAREFASSPND